MESSTSTSTNNNDNTIRLKVAGAVFGSFVGLTIGLTVPFVFTKSILPYMATPGKKIYKALKFLSTYNDKNKTKQRNITTRRGLIETVTTNNSSSNQATATTAANTTTTTTNQKPSMIFVDLGSGDGEAIYQATQLGGYKAIGIELNYTLWLFSILRRQFMFTKLQRQNSTFLRKDFFDYSLSDANIIMIFGVNPLMSSLSEKIQKECQPGTYVLSYRFAIPLNTTTTATAATIPDDDDDDHVVAENNKYYDNHNHQQLHDHDHDHDHDYDGRCKKNENNINDTRTNNKNNPSSGENSSINSNAVTSSTTSNSTSFSSTKFLDADIIYDVNEMRIYKCK